MKPASSLVPVSLPATNHSISTYNDIMDTLHLLEEVPPSLGRHGSTDTNTGNERVIASKWGREEVKLNGSGGLSESKLQSVFSYLDQVEKAEVDRSKHMARPQSDLSRKEAVVGGVMPQAKYVE